MPNFPPVAVLMVTPSELTLPDNRVTLDGSASYDPNPKGQIVKYQFLQDGAVISDSEAKTATAVINIAGDHVLKLICTDRGGMKGESTVPIKVKPAVTQTGKTIFGLQPQGKDAADTVTIIKSLGLKAVRTSLTMVGYNGNIPSFKEFSDAGFDILTNFSYDRGNKFVTKAQMPEYKSLLDRILKDWGKYIKVAVCENEPTNKGENYYDDIIENYIEQLRAFVEVCKANGVKCTDGATHVPYLVTLAAGKNATGNTLDVKKIIEALKTIPVDYANIHFNNHSGSAFNKADIKTAVDYITKTCGKPVLSNENHTEGASTQMIKDVVQGSSEAGLVYSLFFSGDQFIAGKADSLTLKGSNSLSALGVEFAAAVKAAST